MMLCFLEKHEELFHYSNEKRHDDDDRKLFYLSIVFWGTAIEANMRKSPLFLLLLYMPAFHFAIPITSG